MTVWIMVAIVSVGGHDIIVRMPQPARIYATESLCQFDKGATDATACVPYIVKETK